MRYTASHWGVYEIADDGLRPLAGDPMPSRIGRGWLSAARDPDSRIARPVVREGWLAGDGGAGRNGDRFVEVSWERATAIVADELQRVRDAHGNGAVFAGSYGWASAGRFHHAQSQLRRFFNLAGGYVAARDTYSHAAAEVLLPFVTGMNHRTFQDGMTSWPLIAAHCTLLVAFGGISTRTAQITSSGTSVHETGDWLAGAAANGARIVSVSPQRGDTGGGAEWLSIRPGTDTALLTALAHEVVANGWQDDGFLERYTSGWPAYRDYLTGDSDGVPKTADWAARLCDIPARDIRNLAADMAREKTMIAMTWAMQRAHHGEMPLWAGLALAAMLGQIGQPGTGFGFGYGSTTAVGRPVELVPWPSLPQGRNPVSDFIPVARMADMLLHPGADYTYRGERRRYPDIRFVYWAGGNPFHHHQDLFRLERAWIRPETVIVHDHAWTATARRADVVLPATTPLEREDVMMNRRDPALVYMSKAMPPFASARSDHDILAEMASHLGFEAAFTEGLGEEGWLRRLWGEARQVGDARGCALPDFDAFRAAGRFVIPDAERTAVQFGRFVADPDGAPLATESGRITLHNRMLAGFGLSDCPGHPAWIPPAEGLLDAPKGALHLLSPQPDTRLHSQNDRGSEALADKVRGREPCTLHPETAAARGVGEGDIVKLYNARGACLAGVRLDPGLRRDCVALATGAWFDPAVVDGARIDVHGNPNVLTIDIGCSGLSQGNIAHTALVFVEPWRGPLPPITVDRPPPITVDRPPPIVTGDDG